LFSAVVAPNLPPGQMVQDSAAARLNLPAGHATAVELVELTGHAYPAVQFPEHAAVVSPDDDPKVPAGHGAVHDADGKPPVAPYSPALQLVHTPAPPRLYVPAGHTAAVAFVDPAGHQYPAVQFPVHAAEVMPIVEPYTPAGHEVHVAAPPRLYCPAGHTTAVALTDPDGHTYPALHGPSHRADAEPFEAPYRPASQGPEHAAKDRLDTLP
jgi:hypothetical protein